MDRTTVPDTTGRLSETDRTDTHPPIGVSCPVVRSLSEKDLEAGVLDAITEVLR
jgi:hypothetical protein